MTREEREIPREVVELHNEFCANNWPCSPDRQCIGMHVALEAYDAGASDAADLRAQVASHCENRDSLRARLAEVEATKEELLRLQRIDRGRLQTAWRERDDALDNATKLALGMARMEKCLLDLRSEFGEGSGIVADIDAALSEVKP